MATSCLRTHYARLNIARFGEHSGDERLKFKWEDYNHQEDDMEALNKRYALHDDLYEKINPFYRIDETSWVQIFLPQASLPSALSEKSQTIANKLVQAVREKKGSSNIEALMFQYDLSSDEGIGLMCLAEALLRIPDKETQHKLIADKLTKLQWHNHVGKSSSLFVNAATWGLMLTGKILKNDDTQEKKWSQALTGLLNKGGEPLVRQAIKAMMKILGKQFVLGRNINEAIKVSQTKVVQGYRHSYDMLGEAAFTQSDADKYFNAYVQAIQAIKCENKGPVEGPGISVKLSALHPRFIMAKRERLHLELLPKLSELIRQAKDANIGLTIDAEEAHTLTLTLELVEAIVNSGMLKGWRGFGIAVQAYQKRAPLVLDFLIELMREHQCQMMIRLVKGAYWDTEIKLAQVQGLSGYPVFTRKVTTDVNYLVCAKKMFVAKDVIYPQFATHNALTLSTIMVLAEQEGVSDYEFQCLHGMGEGLYDEMMQSEYSIPCRIYAPVGSYEELLPYLVRRLLENGANSSFVNRIQDNNIPISDILASPVEKLEKLSFKPNPKICLPENLYAPFRENSPGVDLSDPLVFIPILKDISLLSSEINEAKPTVMPFNAKKIMKRFSPINKAHYLGTVILADKEIITTTITRAKEAFKQWVRVPAAERALKLEKMAHYLTEMRNQLIHLLVVEGGKTLDDAIAEWRESIDFCFYYAWQAKKHFQEPEELQGPTGEKNLLSLHGRGTFFCISPWNFPLAIFLGQVSAALAAGNCVIAKPASQTVLIAQRVVDLLHKAGIPKEVVQLLPASGHDIAEALGSNPDIQGVLFTGSTDTAQAINQKLAARSGPIIPFIAETGGQNAMIVDSSALAEQVTQDVLTSAFRSAGQRCSALRVLFLQEEVADKMIAMIKGAMAELQIGVPLHLSTDLGPVIDDAAKAQLLEHVEVMKAKGTLLYEGSLPSDLPEGSFFAPRLYEIPSLDILTQEVFGPILHVVRFKADQLDEVLAQINRTGYGLTLGIHSRVNETVQKICEGVQVGNIYVNRNMIGAVVGVQPFGGEKLSGTGPKAGGPYYLPRLAVERSLSINTTASGGNTTLLSLTEIEG